MSNFLNIEEGEAFFVLEVANNHWGDVNRGLKLIRDHAAIAKKHDIKGGFKLQFHERESFVHEDVKIVDDNSSTTDAPGSQSRYAKKLAATAMSKEDYKVLLDEIQKLGFVRMSTPFDERSVELCKELDIDIMKIASSDLASLSMVERVAELGKPTIISTGGATIENIDKVVRIFKKKNVPLAIQHCISKYPSEDSDLELNQIDLLKERYPKHIIGFSTHEYHDWSASMHMAYAKGARTFERHIDIDYQGVQVSKYCSLPEQIDEWFAAYNKAREMSGAPKDMFVDISEKEKNYIKSVVRGMYAKKDLPKGYVIKRENIDKDFFFAIPLNEGQVSSREVDDDIVVPKPTESGMPIYASRDTGLLGSVNWKVFSVLEGVLFAFFFALLYTLSLGGLLGGGLLILLILGSIISIGGYFFARLRKFEIYPSTHAVIGSVVHGLIYSYTVLLSIYLFIFEGLPLLFVVLLYALGPLSVLLYNHYSVRIPRLISFLAIGTLVALSALVALFNANLLPEVKDTLNALMIGLSLPVAHVLGEIVGHRIGTARPISPWVHNFWIGITSLFVASIPLFLVASFLRGSESFTLSSLELGLSVLAGILFLGIMYSRQKTLQTGGRVVLKRGLVYIAFLVVAIVLSLFV